MSAGITGIICAQLSIAFRIGSGICDSITRA